MSGVIEGAVVAGVLAASAVNSENKKSNVSKTVKKLAGSLKEISSLTEEVIRGSTKLSMEALKKLSMKNTQKTKKQKKKTSKKSKKGKTARKSTGKRGTMRRRK